MRISQRLQKLKPSATLTINAKAQELKAQGRKVISLAVGEPDFPTPDSVLKAGKAALDEGFTRYTPVPGITPLRQAVADYYKRFYGLNSASSDWVIVSNGGKQALYNLFMALLDPGDKALIPAPYWVSYPPMIELAEGVPVFVPAGPEKNFLISPEDLERAWTPEVKLLVLNTPSNPTGCHYTQDQLDEIAGWALEREVFVISDEVYDRLVYAPAKPATLSKWLERFPDRFAISGALSKTFCMTGWRVGYNVAHPTLIKAMNRLQGQCTSNISSIAQKAALAALTGPFDELGPMLKAFARRRDLAHSVVSAWSDVVCPKPDGAFYLFPAVDAYFTGEIKNSTDLCALILEKGGVALVPGVEFGDDRCLRFSYAVDDKVLAEALDAVGGVLASLR